MLGRLTVMVAACWALGCSKQGSPEQERPVGELERPAEATPSARRASAPMSRDLMSELAWCDVRHRGLTIDASSDWGDVRRGFWLGPLGDVEPGLRGAVTAGRVLSNRLDYDVWLDRPAKNVYVELRAAGEAASRLVLDVNDRRLGEQRLRPDFSVLRFGPIAEELAAGRHRVSLGFRGRGKTGTPAKAWLQWLRVYLPDNIEGGYVPPTKQNLLQDVVLGGQPRRSIALRAPGSVRCPVLPVRGARLRLDVGYWGSGEGVARVVAHTQEGAKIILAERGVKAEEEVGEWTPLDLSLDAFHDQLVALELDALEASEGGRVVFAEPRVEIARPSRSPESGARNVVVVIAGGLDRRLVPPWAERALVPSLFDLAEQGVVFDGYRAGSTAVSGVVATLLSGAHPLQHALLDPAARLPKGVKLISERMRQLEGVAGFVTNVPYSYAAFGFDRGWNRFEQISLVKDLPATEPIRAGRSWLERELGREPDEKRLLVVHLTGAHPPWDVTQDEASILPPKDYSGVIDPRKGAVALREVRNRSVAARRQLRPEDWVRLEALQQLAVQKMDAALGRLIDDLKRADQWEETLFVFIGDVSMGDKPGIPFAPLGRLEDSRLLVPLIVKFPNSDTARQVHAPLGPESVSRELHEALGLEWPGDEAVASLSGAADAALAPVPSAGQLALQGQTFAFTLGGYRLSGTLGEAPRLCALEVDPSCQTDLYAEQPFVVQWAWRSMQRTIAKAPSQTEREQAEIDALTRAALEVYGL